MDGRAALTDTPVWAAVVAKLLSDVNLLDHRALKTLLIILLALKFFGVVNTK